ncbi:MAG: hypothetical protein V7K21_23910 [Nostoc sp.]
MAQPLLYQRLRYGQEGIVSRHLTPVRSSRQTRPHGWLLYLTAQDRIGSP